MGLCYSAVNVFRPIEEHILQKINRNISLFMCSAPIVLYQEMNNYNLINFLERREALDSLRPGEKKAAS